MVNCLSDRTGGWGYFEEPLSVSAGNFCWPALLGIESGTRKFLPQRAHRTFCPRILSAT